MEGDSFDLEATLARMCPEERRIYDRILERSRCHEQLTKALDKLDNIEKVVSRLAFGAVLKTIQENLGDIKVRVADVRQAQKRKKEANLRYNTKARGRKEAVKLGGLPVHSLGVLPAVARYPGVESVTRRWVEWFHEELERGPDLKRYVTRVAQDWNHCYEKLAVTRSNGYMHYLISEHTRLQTTAYEFTGFSRKHRVPKKPKEIADFKGRPIFEWGRLFLSPVLRAVEFVRDGKASGATFWKTLALLGDAVLQIEIAGEWWDFHAHDDKVFAKMLRRAWPRLQALQSAFLQGLRARVPADAKKT